MLILNSIVSTLTLVFSIFPTVSQLPWGLDSLVSFGFGYVHFMANVIPPLGILLTYFSYFIIFKISMQLLKLIPYIGRLFR